MVSFTFHFKIIEIIHCKQFSVKSILIITLFFVFVSVGAALSNSTHRYGWEPSKELVFRYESLVNTKIPEIRKSQKAGLRMMALVRIQPKTDYSLMIQFEQPRFMTINGVERQEEQEQPIPEPFKSNLVKPFKAHMRRGLVEALFIDANEPVHVVNIKKALLAHLNMDLSASRRNEIDSNRLEIPEEQNFEQTLLEQTYFTVREQSVHGDCQTSYTLHPIPEYEALEIEQQMEQDEQKRNEREHLPGGLSQGGQICRGKKYFQITKTKNFDNCKGQRPVFQLFSGIKAKCDLTKSSCQDLMNHISTTTYVVCGNDPRDFKIRKSITENVIRAPAGWRTEEEFQNKAKIILELIKETSVSSPIPEPSNPKELKSLVFEFPAEYRSHMSNGLSEQERDTIEQESGIRPVMPQPDLRSAPKMLVPVEVQPQELMRQIEQVMQKLADEFFDSPESCTEAGDVAGHVKVITKALRTLSFSELKQVESRIRSLISQQSSEEMKKTLEHIFYDTLSLVGTNPAILLVKEKVREMYQSHPILTYKMLQNVMTSIKTPTREILRELVQLIKNDLRQWSHERPQLFNIGMLQMSRLLHKACVTPLKYNQFPVRIYGPFCNQESQVVEEYISFMEQELEQVQERRIKLNVIAALGKLGHIKVARIMSKVIANEQYSPMVRSVAVYSLKKSAQLHPVFVKPILLAIIDNIAEATEVRIAAVQVLPWAQPNTSELQKIAVRTWFEPSKQVASFIYSTLKALARAEIPELKLESQKVRPLLTLVKPFEFGYQYSKNLDQSTWVEYLNIVVGQQWSYVKTHYAPFPVRNSMITKIFGNSFELNGPKWTVYTQGMDKLINQILFYYKETSYPSSKVQDELSKIVSKLNIKERMSEHVPEAFTQMGIFDYEFETFLGKEQLSEIVNKVSEALSDKQTMEKRRQFTLTLAHQPLNIEALGPCDAGFPIYIERSLPIASAFKGEFEMTTEEIENLHIPRDIRAKIIPVVNIKMDNNIGVISPFNQQLIGAGAEMSIHAATPVEVKASRKYAQLSLDVKIPNEIQKEIEWIHAFIRPFTVRKDLTKVQPISRSSDLKTILSGEPLKKTEMKIGQSLEIDAELRAQSDAKYTDLYSYIQKIMQQRPVSLVHTLALPSSLRLSSAKILFNPQSSKTREISLTLSLVNNKHMKQELSLPLNNKEFDNNGLIRDVCKENFPRSPMQFSKCLIELEAIDVVDQKVNTICSMKPFHKCQELESICDKAKTVCETTQGFKTQRCHDLRETCYRKLFTIQHHQKTMEQVGGYQSGATVIAVRMDAELKSRFGSKGMHTAATFAYKSTPTSYGKKEIEMISNVEVKTPSQPIYEVKLVSKADVPRVSNR